VSVTDRGIRKLGLSLNALLLFLPIALFLERLHPESHTLIFLTSCLAIIPLAGWMGRATEQIAERAGEGVGGLLNATFGNAAELIIALVALRAGQLDIVKASLTGSIIGNILLVLGASFLAGGLYHKIQEFNAVTARAQVEMLLLTSVALIVPGLFHALRPAGVVVDEAAVSLVISCLLIAVYVLSLLFALRTHKELPGRTCGFYRLDRLAERDPRGIGRARGTRGRHVENFRRRNCGRGDRQCGGAQQRRGGSRQEPHGPEPGHRSGQQHPDRAVRDSFAGVCQLLGGTDADGPCLQWWRDVRDCDLGQLGGPRHG
jgi:hypothetical protein